MKSRVEIAKAKINQEKKEERIKNKPKLKKKLKVLLFLLILVVIFLIIYTIFIEPYRLTVNEYKVETTNNITNNYNGLKIVHFSDLHYGSTIKEKELKRIVDKINQIEPDLVLFTGDLIDLKHTTNKAYITTLKKELRQIESNLGKYAVWGNHDTENKYYQEILSAGQFVLLENTYDLIYNKDNYPIMVYGLEDTLLQKPTFDNYMDEITESVSYKIVLVHEPDYINDFVNTYKSDLVLSGHSHNGQVNPLFIKPLFLPLGCRDLYDTYYRINNTDIYISNGLGTSSLPVRFNSIPSINLYRLVKKA